MSDEPVINKKILGVISIVLAIILVDVFWRLNIIEIFIEIFDLRGFTIYLFIIIPIICTSFYLVLRKALFNQDYRENWNEVKWNILLVYIAIVISLIIMGLYGLGASIH